MNEKMNTMRMVKLLLMSILCCFLIACHNDSYRFATGPAATSYNKVGNIVAETVADETRINLKMLPSPLKVDSQHINLNSNNNCRLLLANKADFAITQNDVAVSVFSGDSLQRGESQIRSVVPLYSETFFIIYKKKFYPRSLKQLFQNRRVSLGPKGSGTATFSLAILRHFEIDTTDFTPVYVDHAENVLSDSVDVCCTLTGFDNPKIKSMLENGGKIMSLGNPHMVGKGSATDGFCLHYPTAKPYIIPKGSYGQSPKSAVLTVSVDAVLLVRKDVDDRVVYDIIRVLFDNKHIMMAKLENNLLSNISETFDASSLAFPLHKGAWRYIKRDEPTFLERWAERLALFFSIFLAVVSGAAALAKWQHRRRKNRIDSYYGKVLDVQNAWPAFQSLEECNGAIQQLRELRKNAFQLLIDEKLEANESFRIFITLLNDTLRDLREKKRIIDLT